MSNPDGSIPPFRTGPVLPNDLAKLDHFAQASGRNSKIRNSDVPMTAVHRRFPGLHRKAHL